MWFQKTQYILIDDKPLTEPELAAAFALAVTDKKFRALMQVITELERSANLGAQDQVGNPPVAASCIGGAEHLGMLRARILSLRQQGFGKSSLDRNKTEIASV